jgi:hypothetical protein
VISQTGSTLSAEGDLVLTNGPFREEGQREPPRAAQVPDLFSKLVLIQVVATSYSENCL